jgi:hypothetical protein
MRTIIDWDALYESADQRQSAGCGSRCALHRTDEPSVSGAGFRKELYGLVSQLGGTRLVACSLMLAIHGQRRRGIRNKMPGLQE